MRKAILTKSITIFFAIFAFVLAISAQSSDAPFSKSELIGEIKKVVAEGSSRSPLTDAVRKRGVDFEVTREVSKELQEAGAWSSIIGAAMAGYRPSRSNKNAEKSSGAGAAVILGKYACYWITGGSAYNYQGYFTLKEGGVYQWLKEKTGKFTNANGTVRFTGGPLADAIGKAYRNNKNEPALELKMTVKEMEEVTWACGLVDEN